MAKSAPWLADRLSGGEIRHLKLRRVIHSGRTRFQHVVIAESIAYGRLLVLDDEIQSAAADEHVYHEALVHPALSAHPKPTSVLILGGGEGATAREALRHATVKRVVMVDIDGELVDLCRRLLPTWHENAFRDPRLAVEIGDANAFVASSTGKFDIILSDLPTPTGGPLMKLYSSAFYRKVARCLAAGGTLVVQAGSMSAGRADFLAKTANVLRRQFRHVRPYGADVPSFGEPWGFLIATNGKDPIATKASAVDRTLKARRVKGLKFFDGETLEGLLRIPKNIRDKVT